MLEESSKYQGNLQRHFISRVLLPPFIGLLILGIIGLWQLDHVLKHQAINDLQRSATTTASILHREFTLRETVLKQTGTELFTIKNDYKADRKKLDDDRTACRTYISRSPTSPKQAPNGVCDEFLAGFANKGTSLATLEDEYVRLGEQQIKDQDQRINEHLSAFKQFFPETLAIVVTNDAKQPVSSALSGVFKGSSQVFQTDAVTALNTPITGKVSTTEGYRLAIFAFPIEGGSVLAAYDLQNPNFVRQAWTTAPINRTQAIAVLLDSTGQPAYPTIDDQGQFKARINDLHSHSSIRIKLNNVDNTIVGASAGNSGWTAVVASPTAAVLAPSRDAKLAGIILISFLIVGFLWVGTYFVRHTVRTIVSLAKGAQIFGSGNLDHKIKLEHTDGEFLRLADTMNTMAQRIADAEAALDEKNKQFIAIASHELRSPLTALVGNLSTLSDTYTAKLDANDKNLITEAAYSAVRLRDLVNDMLDVARLESGNPDFFIKPVSLQPAIQTTIAMLAVLAKQVHVSLNYQDEHAANVLADEQYLRIIITNFVSNAIKYNRPGGHIVISHQIKDGQLVTAVADNGLGIPDDQKARMFEKFFRVKHTDRQNVPGTGLGMFITKQYIEQMHGQLWFESTHGKGTTFYFSLPLAPTSNKSQ